MSKRVRGHLNPQECGIHYSQDKIMLTQETAMSLLVNETYAGVKLNGERFIFSHNAS